MTVPLSQALAQAREIEALRTEVGLLHIAHDRADGALADAATVPTGDLERGIRALTAERDGLKADVKALAEALVMFGEKWRWFLRDGLAFHDAFLEDCSALAREGVRRGREEEPQ